MKNYQKTRQILCVPHGRIVTLSADSSGNSSDVIVHFTPMIWRQIFNSNYVLHTPVLRAVNYKHLSRSRPDHCVINFVRASVHSLLGRQLHQIGSLQRCRAGASVQE